MANIAPILAPLGATLDALVGPPIDSTLDPVSSALDPIGPALDPLRPAFDALRATALGSIGLG